ncbi:hypothetical protein ABIB82_001747 [Bradyrhizobium sp. i1.8.4]|uniref:hypothetical protein n=1 Tax=unclassified Bradyrhizobium TaxID=2631580 RepID=UPI003D1A6936
MALGRRATPRGSGAGAQLALTRNAALFANFEGEFSNVTRNYAGKGGVQVGWAADFPTMESCC